jgi:molybdopterin-guanine dinucleotide biosynthesis protein A
MIDRQHITGLVLAGGRGSRMGGVDKGLQTFEGAPLAVRALTRLAPQVDRAMVNANRNLAAYEAMGAPVWPDTLADYPGPLAGFLVGLTRCETPYLVSVPCDSPCFPLDLVARLADALDRDQAEIAIAATRDHAGTVQLQPAFCLMKRELAEGLRDALDQGERKIERWTARHRRVIVVFDDAEAFANVNTLDELQRLQDKA